MFVGLVGCARAGKDEFAKAVLAVNSLARQLTFAREVKLLAQRLIDEHSPGKYDLNNNDGDKLRFRSLLVGLGDGLRAIDDFFWIKKLIQSNLPVINRSDLDFIITDVRYANEGLWTKKEKKGILIRIHRDGFGPTNEIEAKNLEELDMLNMYDRVLNNTGDGLEKYHKACVALFKEVCSEHSSC